MKIRAKIPAPILAGTPFRSYTFTRSMPLLGDPLLNMYPQRSSFSSSRTRFLAHCTMRSVWSWFVRVVTRRGLRGLPTSRNDSRGVPNPHSTSGQTGTYSTYCPSVWVRNGSCLCPPSKRTFSPSKQVLMPNLIFSMTDFSFRSDKGSEAGSPDIILQNRGHELGMEAPSAARPGITGPRNPERPFPAASPRTSAGCGAARNIFPGRGGCARSSIFPRTGAGIPGRPGGRSCR